jgi:hypothetical protein
MLAVGSYPRSPPRCGVFMLPDSRGCAIIETKILQLIARVLERDSLFEPLPSNYTFSCVEFCSVALRSLRNLLHTHIQLNIITPQLFASYFLVFASGRSNMVRTKAAYARQYL